MSDTYGPMSSAPFATWDPESLCWKTSEATSLWALKLSSLTLPTWGGLRSGELYERPTPAPLTNAPAYSSLPTLPTPRATDGPHGGPGQVNGRGVPDSLPAITALLPTPRAAQGDNRNNTIYARPNGPQNLENALHGVITPPQSPNGNTPLGDPHPPQLSLNEQANPN